MTGSTHIAAGAASTLLLIPIYGELSLAALGMGMLGGLFPDLDASESTIKHLGIRITRRFKLKPFLIPAMIVSALCRHRGVVHSIGGLAVCTALVTGVVWLVTADMYLTILLGSSFALGYGSHLLGDGCTVSGVPLWYPLSNKTWHTLPAHMRIKTGTTAESIFDLLFLVSIAGAVLWLFGQGRIVF